MQVSESLPIDAVLDEVGVCLSEGRNAVLVAPPGAGKTTRVPLFLMNAPWTSARTIIVLEPRRLAARAAAERMAQSLGEPVGARVGLRARFDTRISAQTRVAVVTEGVFTRMILSDPALDDVAAVIFDEFHERSLDADLGLALAREAQEVLRPDLRLLVMSATLDGARVSRLLGDAPVVTSEGRAFSVTTRYLGRDPALRIEDDVVRAILKAWREEAGSILVFLPGQREITRVVAALDGRLDDRTDLAPLFGALDRATQDRAVRPAEPGRRKIVLATAIAETSLTIEGVRVVIDSGLARVPRFEADLGITRLETVRVSRASADQRRGRAGRTEPGVCYRLWEEAGTGALAAFNRPEMLDADLSGLLIDLAAWGTRDPATLAWLDPPPQAAVAAARDLLLRLGVLDEDLAITADGQAIAALAVPPRLGRMIVETAKSGAAPLGADLATLLVERGLGGDVVDLTERAERWRRDQSSRARSARALAKSLAASAVAKLGSTSRRQPINAGLALAAAFPERIAKARGKPGEYLLANGRAAILDPIDPLAGHRFLAVGELAGRAAATRILSAAPLSQEDVDVLADSQATVSDTVVFDSGRASLSRRITIRIGAIILSERSAPLEPGDQTAHVLARGIADLGLDRLPWTKSLKQWRDRVAFLHRHVGPTWPDMSDEALRRDAETWLAPQLTDCTSLAEIDADRLGHALRALVTYEQTRILDIEAPEKFVAPTGTHLAIDYEADGGPAIHIRVQELFGLSKHPAVAGGRLPLVLHLLSPGHRPIQVTRDLPRFWSGSWADVRSEMKGRYPRHPWPEDPANAPATTRAKPRGF